MGEMKLGDHLPRFIKLKDEAGEESIHYNTMCRDCPEEVKRYAEKELNETEENKRKGLEKLKEYIKKESLPELEDVHLIAILRCCKYDIKKSEVKLKKFLNVRRIIIKNLPKLNDEKLEHLVSDGFAECLLWTDKHGRPIYIARPSMNLTVYDYADMAVYVQAIFFSIFTYALPTIRGISMIIDCSVKSPSVIFRVINEYKKYLGFERSIPIRIGRIDFVNENAILHNAFALLRPFLPSKISDRIAFHGSDLRKLHKIYHPALLPDDFGGTLGPVDTSLFKEDKLRTINKLKAENFI